MKKTLKIFLVFSFIFLSFIVFTNVYIHFAYASLIKTDSVSLEKGSTALVLGASVTSQKTPSPILQQRLNKAIELYNSGKIKKILLSGDGTDKYYNEVEVMKNYLLARSITEEDIYLDGKGVRTFDSLVRCLNIFKARNIVIVTQRFHLPRALFMAEKLGMHAYGLAADAKDIHSDKFLMLREIFARSLAVIDIYFSKKAWSDSEK